MSVDLADAVAEVRREHGQRYVVAGPSWPEHLPRSFPQSLDLIEADAPDDAPEAEPDALRGSLCGWGGLPRCPRRLERRGLCDEHRAILRAIADAWQPVRRQPKLVGKPKAPPAQPIDPAEVFDAGDRPRVPAAERAEHMARWVHRGGRAVRRADACRVAGVDPMNGSGKNVLSVAEERGWISRGAVGAVLPGEVVPPATD